GSVRAAAGRSEGNPDRGAHPDHGAGCPGSRYGLPAGRRCVLPRNAGGLHWPEARRRGASEHDAAPGRARHVLLCLISGSTGKRPLQSGLFFVPATAQDEAVMQEKQMNRAMVLMVALVLGMPVSASEVEELEAAQEQVPAPESQSTVTKKVYKSYDKDGSVKFTDEPVDGSQEIEVRESNRVQFVRPEVKPSPEDALEQVLDIKPVSYKVNIAAPGDQSHYHNHAEPIPVRVSVQPELQQGDRIEVTDNGEVISPGEGGGYQL